MLTGTGATQFPSWSSTPPVPAAPQYPTSQPVNPYASPPPTFGPYQQDPFVGQPPGASPRGVRPHSRRPLVAASLVTALVLIGGLIAWLAVPGSGGSALTPVEQVAPAVSPQQAPFDEAADALAQSTAAHYTSTAPGSGSGIDVQVTGNGEAVGSASYLGQRFQLLVVEGIFYLKMPSAVIELLPDTVPKDQLKDRWITGDDTLAEQLPQIAWEPWRLAMAVRGALDDPATLLKHVFFDELSTELMNAYLGVPDEDEGYDKELDVTAFLESMERYYDPRDPEAQEAVVTSFILALPWPRRPGYGIKDLIGPVLRAEFERVRPQG